MHFRTIVGPAAEGDRYFHRKHLDQLLVKYLSAGSHLLLSAPRRVGKTSFLKHAEKHPPAGYRLKYHITESINDTNEYFKRLYKSLLEEVSKKSRLWEQIGDQLKRTKVKKLSASGIELGAADVDYYDEFTRLAKELDFEEVLVFVVDEFSQTLDNIVLDHGEKAGARFLQLNRELRQMGDVSAKLRFIYCGSIGLGNIAHRINSSKHINDLTNFPIPPLSVQEGHQFIQSLIVDPALDFPTQTRTYLLDQLAWLIPFYIQIVLDELDTLFLQQGAASKVDSTHIDDAIQAALRNRTYFEHWHQRLRTAFSGNDFTFAKELLNKCSSAKSGFSTTKVFDLAEGKSLRDRYKSIVNTLEYDGYIELTGKKYVFNSPLLRMWWAQNIAI